MRTTLTPQPNAVSPTHGEVLEWALEALVTSVRWAERRRVEADRIARKLSKRSTEGASAPSEEDDALLERRILCEHLRLASEISRLESEHIRRVIVAEGSHPDPWRVYDCIAGAHRRHELARGEGSTSGPWGPPSAEGHRGWARRRMSLFWRDVYLRRCLEVLTGWVARWGPANRRRATRPTPFEREMILLCLERLTFEERVHRGCVAPPPTPDALPDIEELDAEVWASLEPRNVEGTGVHSSPSGIERFLLYSPHLDSSVLATLVSVLCHDSTVDPRRNVVHLRRASELIADTKYGWPCAMLAWMLVEAAEPRCS